MIEFIGFMNLSSILIFNLVLRVGLYEKKSCQIVSSKIAGPIMRSAPTGKGQEVVAVASQCYWGVFNFREITWLS